MSKVGLKNDFSERKRNIHVRGSAISVTIYAGLIYETSRVCGIDNCFLEFKTD